MLKKRRANYPQITQITRIKSIEWWVIASNSVIPDLIRDPFFECMKRAKWIPDQVRNDRPQLTTGPH